MEDQLNNNNGHESVNPGPAKGEFGPSGLTVPLDTGNGLSSGASSAFGSVAEEDTSFGSYGPEERDTLPFSQLGSVYLTPAESGTQGAVPIPAIGTHASTTDIRGYFSRRQARPTLCARGTNYLLPLGGTNFLRFMGGTDITAKGALSAVTTAMNSLVPSLSTPGSYREVANWRRVFDLKNTIISYFNRSIPFTDLEASDRFALEMCYMQEIAFAMLPIYAKAASLEFVKHEQKAGFQYDTQLLQNLNSLTLERLLKQIYAAISELPCIDEVFLTRCAEFSKLRLTAKANGFTPTLLMQDWSPAGPGRYRLSNESMGSGFVTSTGFAALNSPVALNGTTFMEWMEMWLRADKFSSDEVAAVLNQVLQLAQSIRTNYSILLGCAMQLEQKGSVSYATVGSFLPVTGVSEYMLEYKSCPPSFNYAFKERFEYAPRRVVGEYTGGSALTWLFNLTNLPAGGVSDPSRELRVLRPVGLYKGSKAWTTKELTNIGLFKEAGVSIGTNRFTPRQVIGVVLGVSTTNITIGADGTQNFEDAYYGDIYVTGFFHINKVAATDTSYQSISNSHELVSYYGLDGASPVNAPFATLSTWYTDGGTISTPMDVIRGTQLLDCSPYAMSGSDSPALVLIPQIIALLQQLDLTFYASSTDNVVGQISTPIIVFTNYRGCEFDEIDMAPVENAAADSYRKLTIALKVRARGGEADHK